MSSKPDAIDWVAAYNDLHWLIEIRRASRTLGLSAAQEQLLLDLYGRVDQRPAWQN